MIEIALNNVQKYYGSNHVLKGVSFEIQKGDRIGLLGRNGAGKTTVYKILSGKEGYEEGEVHIRKDLKISVLDQIPVYPEDYTVIQVIKTAYSSLNNIQSQMMALEEEMAVSFDEAVLKRYGALQSEFEAGGGYDIESKVNRVCSGLEIDSEMLKKCFCNLSGGEQTRINLARLILSKPEVLLLDEPTNHLDIKSIEWLEEYLSEYSGTVVVISHDRYFLDHVVKRIIEIENGIANMYEGNYSYYIREKEERYEAQLSQYEQQQKKIKQLDEAAKRLHQWGQNADNPALHKKAFAIEKRIERMEKTDKPIKERAMTAGFKENSFSGADVIRVEALYKSYSGKRVLNGVDLLVQKGDKIALLGENGSGKSTLIKAILGELLPDNGVATIGESIKAGYLPQIVVFEDTELNILDTVRQSLEVNEETARRLLAKYRYKGEDVQKKVKNLSGGEKSRLRLCILMQDEVNLLVLDEPTNHLDIASREWVEEALEDYSGTMLFISHDRYFINRFANRISHLNNGVIEDFSGSYEEYKVWKQGVERNVKTQSEDTSRIKTKTEYISDNDKKPKVDIDSLESMISHFEGKLSALEKNMLQHSSDYDKLSSLFAEKKELLKELEDLYGKWEDAIS